MLVVLWQQVILRVCAGTEHSFTGLVRDSDFILIFILCNMTAEYSRGFVDFYNQLR